MKKNIILTFVGLLIILLYINKIYSPKENKNEIKIGSILILTGEGASWGEASQNGIEMAIQEINKNGALTAKTCE